MSTGKKPEASPGRKYSILTFSARGEALGARLRAWFSQENDVVQDTIEDRIAVEANAAVEGDVAVKSDAAVEIEVARCPAGGLDAWTRARFDRVDGLIFVGSCGLALRAVAPYVVSKTTDPAVVVLDEQGTFSVSLLSGHLGGANRLAEEVARAVGAMPVITTATDRAGVFAVDTWAKEQGLSIANPEKIKIVSARLLAGESVTLASDVTLSYRTQPQPDADGAALQLVPPVLTLGVGCRKGIAAAVVEAGVSHFLAEGGYHPAALKQVCTIDLKAQEEGLLTFCRAHDLPLHTYSAQELQALPGVFHGSEFVRSVTGVDNVCERSALLGSGPNGTLLRGKTVYEGLTLALAMTPCVVEIGGEAPSK